MSVTRPEELHAAFASAFSRGDLVGLLELFEPAGALVPQPGQPPVSGAAMQEALKGLLALKPTLQLSTERVLPAGDVMLLRSQWTLTGTAPDGRPVTMTGRGVEVARRQANGTWRFVIDDPFGGAS